MSVHLKRNQSSINNLGWDRLRCMCCSYQEKCDECQSRDIKHPRNSSVKERQENTFLNLLFSKAIILIDVIRNGHEIVARHITTFTERRWQQGKAWKTDKELNIASLEGGCKLERPKAAGTDFQSLACLFLFPDLWNSYLAVTVVEGVKRL